MSNLGVKRVTISPELNEENIKNLIKNYKETYNANPNFEMIVYGRASLMHSKYCPLKRLGMCGKCKTGNYALKDQYETFPIKFNEDCTINLLNSRTLNLLDEIPNIKGINYFRLVFTTETLDEIKHILNIATKKISGINSENSFNGSKHTRGNFRKQLL